MFPRSLIRCALIFAAGAATGAVASALLARNSGSAKRGAAQLLSHGLDIKERAKSAIATTKENFSDLAAEAQEISDKRNSGK